MKPVNLLPQNERAAKPAEGLAAAPTWCSACSAALAARRGLTSRLQPDDQVNDRAGKIEKAQAESQQAEQRATALGAFGSFASVKQQREESVRDLAKARFDWERFMRELSRIMPEGSWLQSSDASVTGAPGHGRDHGASACRGCRRSLGHSRWLHPAPV